MEELISILQDIKDDVDFENCTTLIDDGILNSFDILQIISALNDAYDISIPASEIVPKNFNSAAALYAMVQQEQLKGVEKFHSVDSFRQYLINMGIKDVPSNSTISGRYGCLRHNFPDWVFSDGCDATEAQRRINIAKRFLCLFLKGK